MIAGTTKTRRIIHITFQPVIVILVLVTNSEKPTAEKRTNLLFELKEWGESNPISGRGGLSYPVISWNILKGTG